VDTSKQALNEVRLRRRWTIEEKRRIAQETYLPGASVARIAQSYALNANQLFLWRRLYREGRLGNSVAKKLLPVTITDERLVEAVKVVEAASPSPLGTIEIKLAKGNVHIAGRVDLVVLRTALECLF
jgi:Transposase and inactivated derivatives